MPSATGAFESGGSGTELLTPPSELDAERRRVREPRRTRRRRRGGGRPPGRSGGDGGDGGSGGGGGDGEERPERPGGLPLDAAQLALLLLLLAIVTLFAVFLATYAVLWRQSPERSLGLLPDPPWALWGTTALLVASSATLHRSGGLRRSGAWDEADRWLAATWGLGAAFLVAQAWLLSALVAEGFRASDNAYLAIFFALTGLHAVHLAGGLVYLTIVLRRCRKERGGATAAGSARLCAVYWHFMLAVWLVLFVVLYFFD